MSRDYDESPFYDSDGVRHRFKEQELVNRASASRNRYKRFTVNNFFVKATPYPVNAPQCPDEIWEVIFSLCDVKTLKTVRILNKRMSEIALRYLVQRVLIFEFPCGEYGRYGPVANSLIETCRKHTTRFTYRTVGLCSTDKNENNRAFAHRISYPLKTYMGHLPWESLTYLRLDYLFIQTDDLLKILHVNRLTLKVLTLHKPCLRGYGCQSWPYFFKFLRHYHKAGEMKLDKLYLRGWLQWTFAECCEADEQDPDSCYGCRTILETPFGKLYPYKMPWALETTGSGGRVPTLERMLESFVIHGGYWPWNNNSFMVYVGPLQGSGVAKEEVRNEWYQNGWYY